ncbi:MAG: rod shape-determining protein [Acutalibacteraceae bacterium]|nr:rod shape-determining protein [Acutalibacteraceae bacterium]
MTGDIGIDLGSSKTVIFSDSGIVIAQPSVVTVDAETYATVYFGEKAKQTMGRTPDTLECVRPIEHGLIADYDIAEAMLKNYMDAAFGNKVIRPKVMATLPTGLTELQHHSLANVVQAGGGRSVNVVEAPIAIAIGLGLDFSEPSGNLVVDIGAGTTDIAVLSLGGIVSCDSFKTASFDFDDIIINHVRRKRNIAIGNLTAENIKIQIGSVSKRPVEVTAIAKGRNLFSGLPEAFEITSGEIYAKLNECAVTICNAIRKVLSVTEPDLVADIKQKGLHLVGGGSKMFGMAELISEYIGIEVITYDEPELSLVKGATVALSKPELLKNINYQARSLKELEIK